MCAIGGLINFASRTTAATRMQASMNHRGPDSAGKCFFNSDRFGAPSEPADSFYGVLIHNRLSILDLSECGAQPMISMSGRSAIVFNGEIYNYLELKKRYLPDIFLRGGSDTEVLLEILERNGSQIIADLQGMYAFAYVNLATRKLTLARDPYGIKPLYVFSNDDGLAFSSELKAVLATGLIDPKLNRDMLFRFLRWGLSNYNQNSFVKGISQLRPGEIQTYQMPECRLTYSDSHNLPGPCTTNNISLEDAVRSVKETFLESVEKHMRSDVPIAVALSGGIDSSAVVSAVRLLRPKDEIVTFSYISDDAVQSEEKWVDRLSQELKLRSIRVRVAQDEILSHIDRFVHIQDEPVSTTSPLAQYFVFRAARVAGFKVMLNGQGADEQLAGYERYRGAFLLDLIADRDINTAAKLLLARLRISKQDFMSLVSWACEYGLPQQLALFLRSAGNKARSPAWIKGIPGAQGVSEPRHDKTASRLKEVLLQDFCTRGLPNLLRFDDRNSMANSVESRVPFLFVPFVNAVFSLPARYLVSETGETKFVFRRAMDGIVPQFILKRQDKIGFATPQAKWLTGLKEWETTVLREDLLREVGFASPRETLKHLMSDPVSRWRVANLLKWLEVYNVKPV